MAALERLTSKMAELDQRTKPFEGFTPPRDPQDNPNEGTSARPSDDPSPCVPPTTPEVSLHPCPAARKLPFSAISPEWNILEPGFVLGQQPHTLILPDGRVWGPDMIEVNEDTYVVPVWRMRKLKAPSRQSSVLLPVREAYDAMASFFSEAPTFASEWSGATFHPPGSTSSRALEVNLSEATFLPAFFKQVPLWFKGIAARDAGKHVERKKALWEEATTPSNLVPSGIENLVPADYVAFFAEPEFSRSQATIELDAKRLSKVPPHIPKEEHKSRVMLLTQLNNAIGSEVLALRLGTDTPAGASARALVKGNLLSLWQAFHAFAVCKLTFRKRALKGCFSENVLYQRLVSGNPLSASLFDPETVADITNQAGQQARSVLQTLGYQASFKRQLDNPSQPRAKKAKTVVVSRQQTQDQAGTSKQSTSQEKPRSRNRPPHFKAKRSSGNRRRRDRPARSQEKGAGPSKESSF